MSFNARSIATLGIGFGSRHVAAIGLVWWDQQASGGLSPSDGWSVRVHGRQWIAGASMREWEVDSVRREWRAMATFRSWKARKNGGMK